MNLGKQLEKNMSKKCTKNCLHSPEIRQISTETYWNLWKLKFGFVLKMVEILDKPRVQEILYDFMPFHDPHVANSHNLGDPRLDQATLAGISSFPPSQPGCGMIL